MAACPRADIVRSGDVGVYHCSNRCVRRAFLCGHAPRTGKNFDYRRDWILSQDQLLARLFAVEIAFPAETPEEACHSSAYDRCGWMTT
jgi:hypothetical protein